MPARGLWAVTMSPSNVMMVRRHIARQEEHPRKRTIEEAYREVPARSGIPFDELYFEVRPPLRGGLVR